MPTKYADVFAALAAPFEPGEVKQRPGGKGKMLHYITARSAMNRLDEVLGPENWSDSYAETRTGLMCVLTITLPDGKEVSKADGGGPADMGNADDTEKSSFSHAFKRAAAKYGVGRYLYQDGVPDFAEDAGTGHAEARASVPPPRESRPAPNGNGHNGNGNGHHGPPTSGRGLFAFLRELGQKHQADFVGGIQNWGKQRGYPDRLIDWTAEQVDAGHKAALRKVEDLAGKGGGASQATDPMQAARDRLTGVVARLVHKLHGPHAPDNKFYEILDQLAGDAGGEVIDSVSSCDNRELMERYIEVATERLNVGV